MPIEPHTVEEHGVSKAGAAVMRQLYVCDECGFCQCEELEGDHSLGCSLYVHYIPDAMQEDA